MNTLKLPGQTFFKPNNNWWKLLADTPWLHHRKFVDIGAGQGLLTLAMLERGYETEAIDLNHRAGQHGIVQIGDAADQYYTEDHCLVVARPCHGHFYDQLWRRHAGRPDVLYVGLGKNMEMDLHGTTSVLLASNVGEDGEDVYQVLCIEAEEEQGLAHGGQIREPIKDYLSRRGHETCGWILPDGTFYPVQSTNHAVFLAACLGITEARAEELHFVRCYGAEDHQLYSMRLGGSPSKAQKKRLVELGYHVRHDLEEVRTS